LFLNNIAVRRDPAEGWTGTEGGTVSLDGERPHGGRKRVDEPEKLRGGGGGVTVPKTDTGYILSTRAGEITARAGHAQGMGHKERLATANRYSPGRNCKMH
jgi:hypothetical protein